VTLQHCVALLPSLFDLLLKILKLSFGCFGPRDNITKESMMVRCQLSILLQVLRLCGIWSGLLVAHLGLPFPPLRRGRIFFLNKEVRRSLLVRKG
jgi:hypothetical protein